MQKYKFITKLVLEMKLTQYLHNFGHAQAHLATPTCDVWVNLLVLKMSNYIQKILLHTSTRL